TPVTVQYTVLYPLASRVADAGEWCRPSVLADFARALEDGGFNALAFSDHPAATADWLEEGGGHAAMDPFVALGHCAAYSDRFLLMISVAIAAYGTPFLLAKSAASTDLVSDGRLVLGLGAGYLKGEFDALGANYDRRAEALREAL